MRGCLKDLRVTQETMTIPLRSGIGVGLQTRRVIPVSTGESIAAFASTGRSVVRRDGVPADFATSWLTHVAVSGNHSLRRIWRGSSPTLYTSSSASDQHTPMASWLVSKAKTCMDLVSSVHRAIAQAPDEQRRKALVEDLKPIVRVCYKDGDLSDPFPVPVLDESKAAFLDFDGLILAACLLSEEILAYQVFRRLTPHKLFEPSAVNTAFWSNLVTRLVLQNRFVSLHHLALHEFTNADAEFLVGVFSSLHEVMHQTEASLSEHGPIPLTRAESIAVGVLSRLSENQLLPRLRPAFNRLAIACAQRGSYDLLIKYLEACTGFFLQPVNKNDKQLTRSQPATTTFIVWGLRRVFSSLSFKPHHAHAPALSTAVALQTARLYIAMKEIQPDEALDRLRSELENWADLA